MSKPSKYQTLLDEFSSWLKQASESETRSIAQGMDLLQDWIETGVEVHKESLQHSLFYLKRDLASFYDSYQRDSNESPYYLSVKDQVWQTLAEMTDKTQIEWREFSSDTAHKGVYKAGEEVGFGELICLKCGEKLIINHAQKIHPCFNCQHTEFKRRAIAP
ncbi:hypothetical protein N7931_07270 [Catenovulum sp. 2E275]|uniref:zinc ribbon-containing protein n=1 Tax=Catenovulum sp. 2E275 TaxID=2980497 RepID=UPI0021CE6702|nr:hypothetical protein [Catenovulum sp. 2E275]MCU4675432.1 hypothetical protein [Catenovulum sp. 2E275]